MDKPAGHSATSIPPSAAMRTPSGRNEVPPILAAEDLQAFDQELAPGFRRLPLTHACSESQAAVLAPELPRAFVDTTLAIVRFLFQHTGSGQAALTQFPFQIRTRFCAITKSRAACGHERHETGGEAGIERSEPSGDVEHLRQVSGCRSRAASARRRSDKPWPAADRHAKSPPPRRILQPGAPLSG
jgi:hypothetical protein